MNLNTIAYLILAALMALGIAYFQYFYKAKKSLRSPILLFILRALSLFLLCILFINPTIDVVQIDNIKPNLAVVLDNSKSVKYFGEEANIKQLKSVFEDNTAIKEKFALHFLTFGERLRLMDTLSLQESKTNISEALNAVKELYDKGDLATVIVTDGNQTAGEDYEYRKYDSKIFPVLVGDTTKYQDVQITQLNVNKFSYLKNKFPVEALILYEGDKSVNTKFTLSQNGKKIYTEDITLTPENPVKTISTTITSQEKGIQYYRAALSALDKEKNIRNNIRNFSVDVIDEQTKVLVLSSVLHPDLGVLKKSIESNEQRKVDIRLIGKDNFNLEDYQFYIFYQPNIAFKNVLEKSLSNFLIITGSSTDWRFLNSLDLGIRKEAIRNTENYSATYNANFLNFIQEDIGFEDFPPLKDKFGKISFSENMMVLLYQKINGIATDQPLLAGLDNESKKYMFILGEGIWKWRANTFIQNKTFEPFDAFIGNMVQYLSSNKKRDRLVVQSKNIYPANSAIQITASYLDKNYKFDKRASLQIKIINEETKKEKLVPFSLKTNAYQVDIEDLTTGTYFFRVTVEGQTMQRTGKFKIIPFEIEQQSTNANEAKLQKLAANSNGKLYHISNYNSLIKDLLADENLVTRQSSSTSKKNLIDWKWILGIVILFLSLEWFIRKYMGKM